MPRDSRLGSTSKEPPLAKLDATLEIVLPGMTRQALRARAAQTPGTHPDAPGLIVKRFLSLDAAKRIRYDGLLALIRTHGIRDPRVRKIMYFVWVWRDERIRSFVLEKIADATGRWSVDDLSAIEHKSHFERYFKPSTAKKTRSNFQQFLESSGIFDPAAGTVDFSLDDGWLSDAMAIVAADEAPEVRARMLGDPVGFLFERKWNGLIDLADGAHPRNAPGELETWEYLDDARIPASTEAAQGESREWRPRDVGALQARRKALQLDLVALERASKAHQALERLAAAAVRGQGAVPRSTPSIDMYYEGDGVAVIMEMKSCHARNVHSQIRKGVSQLLEYRYTNRKRFPGKTELVLILETSPERERRWLVDYLVSIGICPAWKNPAGDALVTTAALPAALAGVIQQIGP
jgi:hypothetical protein